MAGSIYFIIFSMSIYHRRTQALVSAFWIAVLAGIWILFAPVPVGGQASYVIVAGQSMEPGMHFGDLVIVHKSANYQIGDVVAYNNADLDHFVIHRIINVKHGHFLLKGDNNSWVDKYEPVSQEILGKLWLYLPKFGVYIQKLRQPFYMALFAGLSGGLVVGTIFVSKQRESKTMDENRKKRELNFRKRLASLVQNSHFIKIKEGVSRRRSDHPEVHPSKQDSNQKSSQQKNMMETFFFALAVVAFLSLVLGLLSYIRPASQTVSDDVNYQHLGLFSYSAPAPAGIYDSATIKSGEPIFPSLTCSVNIVFNYTLVSTAAENFGGSYQLTAILTHSQSGWQRTLPLQERSSFSGVAFNTQAELNLCEIVKLIESVEEITTARQGSYLLSISPQVQVSGLVQGRALETSFEPKLSFLYDRTQFYLADQAEKDQLNPSEMGFLHAEKQIPSTVSLLGTELNVPALRGITLVGLVVSLSGLAFLGLQLENMSHNDRETFVRMKYAPLVIDVEPLEVNQSTPQIAVNSIDDLAKLAEIYNAMILHYSETNVDQYLVYMNGFSYIFSQIKNQSRGSEIAMEENIE